MRTNDIRLTAALFDAQNVVYLTVNLPEINESTLDLKLEAKEIKFKCKAGRYGRSFMI